MEWKPLTGKKVFLPCVPLKPSLVEWKHARRVRGGEGEEDLETFLSGMETVIARSCEGVVECLETFLSGMETRLLL